MPEIKRDTITLKVSDGTEMRAFVARPAGADPHPGMIVFQEAFGLNDHLRDICARFAREGYVAIAPELFHRTAPGFEAPYTDLDATRPHTQALNNEGLEGDTLASHAWLRAEGRTHDRAVAAIGFCMGGRVAYLASTVAPLQAAISFYGGGIAPNPRTPGLLDRASRVSAPLLLFWGGLDVHIPPVQTRAVVDALSEAKKPFVNVEISNADHGFFCDQRSSYSLEAARYAWTLVRAFLATHMAAPPAAQS